MGLAISLCGCAGVPGGVTASTTVPGAQVAEVSIPPDDAPTDDDSDDVPTDGVPVAVPRDLPPEEPVAIPVEGDDSWPRRRVDRHGISVSTLWVPAIHVSADEDENEPGGGLAFEADLSTDEGQALVGRYELAEGRTVGFTYLWSEHRERDTDTKAHVHAGTIDFGVRATMDVDGPVVPFAAASCGFGVAGIDFDGPIDDNFSATILLHGQLGLELFEGGEIHIGAGGMWWGYPGETFGRGVFWTLGATVRF